MSRQRIVAVEYIRGISMLGVIGIHTGAYSLSNPFVNIHLFALFEIFTRFSVPIFFFVSAFGLFISHNLSVKLSYIDFMKRRFRTVLIPYITWSLLYMFHYTLVSGDTSIWHGSLPAKYFIFGLASYQLYFLVIMLWFYMLMPLWRTIVRRVLDHPIRSMGFLLILQIVFNYYSSYVLSPVFSNHYLNLMVQYRLSYWVFHYIFIFLLGAVCAVQYHKFKNLLGVYRKQITVFFVFSLTGMLIFYYYLMYGRGYSPEQAVNTAHQLSPMGVVYTLAATLFWFMLFEYCTLNKSIKNFLNYLGKHSYMVYLVHPLIMYYLTSYLTAKNIVMSASITISFYCLTVMISLAVAAGVQLVGRYVPLLRTLLTGSSISKIKSGT